MKIFAFTLIFLTLAGSAFACETFNAVNLSAQDAEVSQSVSSLHEKSFVVNEELRNINGINFSVKEAEAGQAVSSFHEKSPVVNEELKDINGVNLSVQEAGEGQAMILLHGKGYSKEYMNSLFDYYKGKYHIFSYDSRGHGKSDKPESFTLDDNADDLAGLIKSYGLYRPIIIGFSMGSYITLKAAEKYPDLFSKIVLIGTRGQGDTYPPERISEAKDANDAAIIGSLINFDLITDIKNVKIPALVITGENDKINPVDEGRKVAEALNDAKFYVIPNAEHVAFMKPEGFERVCNLIDEFLTLELDYSDHEPLGNMRTTFLNDVFFPAIERETQGRVKIKSHWNAEISTGYNAIKAINQGSADLAVVVPEYCMNSLHLHQLFKSFPVGPSGQEQVNFFRNVYHEIPELVNELEANNLHAVIIATGYPAAFFSAKPLANLQAVKGQRWRSASFWHKDFLSNAGAEPVTMAWGPGVSDALNDGTLDGLIVNIDSGYDINAHKPAPNILVSQKLWLGHEYIIAINKSIWDNLAQADKDAIYRAAESSYSVLGEIMNTSFTRQIETLRADGAEVRIMNDDEVSFWENSTNYEAIQDKWISDDVKAAEALKKLRELIKN